MVPLLGDRLQVLVAAACGAQPPHSQAPIGEHMNTSVCLPQPRLLNLCIQLGVQAPWVWEKADVTGVVKGYICDKRCSLLHAASIMCVMWLSTCCCVIFCVQGHHLASCQA
jgi:hypothetical protein